MSGRRRRTTIGIAAAGVVAIAAVAAVSIGVGRGGADADPGTGKPHVGTAAVVQTTLTAVVTAEGEVGYGHDTPITSKAAGTLTWLPAAGTTVRQGEPVLRADNKPVVLLYGDLPMYRPLQDGVEGPDVKQLEENLRDLKYAGFTVDSRYSSSTAGAVKQWQRDLELTPTGTVAPTDVIVAPGALRIVTQTVRPGAPAAGDVLSATSTARVVTAKVPADRQELTTRGTRATILLGSGKTVDATVTGPVGSGTPAAGDAAADPAEQRQRTVSVGLKPKSTAGLSPGPVSVRFVTDRRVDVLAVPVQALLALGEGGYGVEIRTGGTSRVVAVRTGLVSGGQVEITGDGITEGTTVGVAE